MEENRWGAQGGMGSIENKKGAGGNPMKESLKTGISFGLTSGVITTLGLMVGLHSGTH